MTRAFSSAVRKLSKEFQEKSGNLLSVEERFYVYVLLDPRKPGTYSYDVHGKVVEFDHEPFYVGKGCGKRMYAHKYASQYKDHHKDRRIEAIRKSGNEFIAHQVSTLSRESVALAKEFLLIKSMGRRSLGKGPLTNHSDGGTGPIGHKRPQSEKDAISLAMTGVPKSDKTRGLMSKAARSRGQLTCPNCGIVGTSTQMKRWHFDKCTTDPSTVVNGKRPKPRPRVVTDKVAVVKMVKSGASQKSIAAHFGVCREIIRRITRAANL